MTRITQLLILVVSSTWLVACAHTHQELAGARVIPHDVGDGPEQLEMNAKIFCEYKGGLIKVEGGKAFCRSGTVRSVAAGASQ